MRRLAENYAVFAKEYSESLMGLATGCADALITQQVKGRHRAGGPGPAQEPLSPAGARTACQAVPRLDAAPDGWSSTSSNPLNRCVRSASASANARSRPLTSVNRLRARVMPV